MRLQSRHNSAVRQLSELPSVVRHESARARRPIRVKSGEPMRPLHHCEAITQQTHFLFPGERLSRGRAAEPRTVVQTPNPGPDFRQDDDSALMVDTHLEFPVLARHKILGKPCVHPGGLTHHDAWLSNTSPRRSDCWSIATGIHCTQRTWPRWRRADRFARRSFARQPVPSTKVRLSDTTASASGKRSNTPEFGIQLPRQPEVVVSREKPPAPRSPGAHRRFAPRLRHGAAADAADGCGSQSSA